MHGLKAGTLYQGKLRILQQNANNAFVTCQGMERDVFIDGRKNRNRVSCIQLLRHVTYFTYR